MCRKTGDVGKWCYALHTDGNVRLYSWCEHAADLSSSKYMIEVERLSWSKASYAVHVSVDVGRAIRLYDEANWSSTTLVDYLNKVFS